MGMGFEKDFILENQFPFSMPDSLSRLRLKICLRVYCSYSYDPPSGETDEECPIEIQEQASHEVFPFPPRFPARTYIRI